MWRKVRLDERLSGDQITHAPRLRRHLGAEALIDELIGEGADHVCQQGRSDWPRAKLDDDRVRVLSLQEQVATVREFVTGSKDCSQRIEPRIHRESDGTAIVIWRRGRHAT